MKKITPAEIEKMIRVCPKVGDLIYVRTGGSPFSIEPKRVLFKNRYGVLCQWKTGGGRYLCHDFYTFDLCEFVLVEKLEKEGVFCNERRN